MHHLTPRLIEQLLASEAPAAEATHQLLRHLAALCPHCRSLVDAATATRALDWQGHMAVVFDQALHRTLESRRNVDRQRDLAERDRDELLGLDAATRQARIDRAIKRFRNPFLVDLLITESRSRLTSSPAQALELAECAYQVALRLPHNLLGDSWAMTCVARANAYRGNALRVLGELKAAQAPLEMALSLFQEKGDADPLVEAELLSLLASLHKDRLQFAEAEAVLERALDRYRAFGKPARIARILIKLAIVLADSDRLQEAIATAQEAVSMLDPERDAYLYLTVQHNLTHYLEAAGRLEEAHELLHANLERYRSYPEPVTRLRLLWNWARIAVGLDRMDSARATLEDVRVGFLRQGMDYDAALVGLDLALILIDTNETEALVRLASEILPVFEAQEMERDTIAVLLVFREAVQKREVTSQLVSRLLAELKRAPRPAAALSA